ncbi:MAG: AAA family ATPase [Epsilonproteobacteria bacterium]|nr:AAA family ATPase [Campylobacterota bacterium]
MDIEKPKSINIIGTLKKVLYHNSENNYYIAILENNQKICGQYFDTDLKKLEGEDLIIVGNWETHNKYGVQFNFETLEIKKNEVFFFLTKIVKGFTNKLATEITKKYTENELYEILDNRPSVLLEFKGLKEKKLTQIVTSWNKFKHLRELAIFLGNYGVTKNLINKIFQELGHIDNLIEKIKENPYFLTTIKGVGFKKADEIALAFGIDLKSPFRIKACLNYALMEYCEANGNSSISKYTLYTILDGNLDFENEEDLYKNVILEMIADKDLIETKTDRYTTNMLYFCEKSILEFFKKRQNRQIPITIIKDFDTYITQKEKTIGFTLSEEQKKAVRLINEGETTVLLVGYAGTGKSTSSRAILELLEEIVNYKDIHCMALSGIASQRISETTGYSSSTIQSLLITHKEKDYFPYKVLLLDEASMVNSVTFYQIISKISDDTIFIIVGDDGQLPAIGAGDILADAIKFNLAPLSKLTKIYRQNELQAIATIANEIREGSVPIYQKEYKDFKFVDVSIPNYYATKNSLSNYEMNTIRNENNYKILNSLLHISASYIWEIENHIKEKQIAKALTTFQVITPMKNGTLGVENLNINLQKLLNNNNSKAFQGKTYEFRLKDKVIHTKNENMKSLSMNDYKNGSIEYLERRIFNGMLGMIIKLDFENEHCVVLYPNDDTVVFYSFAQIESLLSLAYCLTIHKTQGMEYDTALIPMTFTHFIMHNTKLLYTAITRAKNMCYIIGEKEAFESACKKLEITQRETVITDLLGEN